MARSPSLSVRPPCKTTPTAACPTFFFSSRRRHTRSTRDWSSDVCSSDLWPDFAICVKTWPNWGSFEADVSSDPQLGHVFTQIAKSGHLLDGLVTCAGITNQTPILELTVEEWDRCLAVNLRGTFLCVQGALRQMVPRKVGRIVTVGSDVGKRGGGRLAKS